MRYALRRGNKRAIRTLQGRGMRGECPGYVRKDELMAAKNNALNKPVNLSPQLEAV